MIRPSWKIRAPGFSDHGVLVRSVDEVNLISTNVLHYSQNTTFFLGIAVGVQNYILPLMLILRILVSYTEYHIFTDLIQKDPENSVWRDSAKCMLADLHASKVLSSKDAKNYLGQIFRVRLSHLPNWSTDSEIADYIIKKFLLVHLTSFTDKYNFLIYMTHKLMALVDKKINQDNPDALNNQEILLPGQVYQVLVREKMERFLDQIRSKAVKMYKGSTTPITQSFLSKAMTGCIDIGLQMENFLKTGNIHTRSRLGLPQLSGYTILADRINFVRYFCHFRSVHRGSYHIESYSTKVRKLLPECWGFICPVNTPDGSPCGILTHLSQAAQVTCRFSDINPYKSILVEFGILSKFSSFVNLTEKIEVIVDGHIVGFADTSLAPRLLQVLVEKKIQLRDHTEIFLIPKSELTPLFPGLFIFSGPSRLFRSVFHIESNMNENLGTFEQLYAYIALDHNEAGPKHTHIEYDPCSILSVSASTIPFSNYNQSPRNMYQCQMMKQSMGVPILSHRQRFFNRMFRLLSVQSPLCQSPSYYMLDLDSYPLGLNAVVAVISYTGYDMEDAIAINKSSLERGFGAGCIYKSIIINLSDEISSNDHDLVFKCRKTDHPFYDKKLDTDGLPPIGRLIDPEDILYSYLDVNSGEYRTRPYKGEAGYVDDIAILDRKLSGITKIAIRIRIPRNPTVGDKFSSRHGQKGINSISWPAEDMPFTEQGIVPDIIFNPHGFPSRMTIGMLIESMASKVGALTGKFYDSSPFKNSDTSVVDYFGRKLTEAGFDYYGSDRMYSGTSGEELEVSIFTGIVYYQRLRHMVSDKDQVRVGGNVEPCTRQPVGGRFRGGGIRFGEMERDALISHGCSYLLQDRLLDCSDKSKAFVCQKCGDMLSTKLEISRTFNPLVGFHPPSVTRNINPSQYTCLLCKSSGNIKCVFVPHVFRYFLAELASMNIRVKLKV